MSFRAKVFGVLILSAGLALSACSGGSRPSPTSASSGTTAATPTAPIVLSQDPDMDWGPPLFVEDFSQPLSADRWHVYQAPTKSPYPTSAANTSVQDGLLHLTGQLDGPTADHGRFRDQGAGTASSLNQVYGRWEARIKVEAAPGYGVAMTIWPQSNVWPRDGEIDVMEIHDATGAVAENTVHNGVQNLIRMRRNHGSFTGWHVYGVDWEPDSIRYYLDGKLTFTVTDPALIPRDPMHATLQLGVECKPTWRACQKASAPPVVSMWVDWIKAFAPAATR